MHSAQARSHKGQALYTKYYYSFRKALQYLPHITDSRTHRNCILCHETILRSPPAMLGGQKGKPWKDFESLLDFAIAKEMTIQSGKKKKKKHSRQKKTLTTLRMRKKWGTEKKRNPH